MIGLDPSQRISFINIFIFFLCRVNDSNFNNQEKKSNKMKIKEKKKTKENVVMMEKLSLWGFKLVRGDLGLWKRKT